MNEIDALVDAIEASDGLPVPTPRGWALRIIEQLARRGYAITPVDNPLGLTEQQQSDSALNEMIETLPSPLKNMSGMYNGMTVRPVEC